jgi:hypothetical protein
MNSALNSEDGASISRHRLSQLEQQAAAPVTCGEAMLVPHHQPGPPYSSPGSVEVI